jgi:hypothetical protein
MHFSTLRNHLLGSGTISPKTPLESLVFHALNSRNKKRERIIEKMYIIDLLLAADYQDLTPYN